MRNSLILFACLSIICLSCQNDNTTSSSNIAIATTISPALEAKPEEEKIVHLPVESASVEQESKTKTKPNSLSQKNTWKSDFTYSNQFFEKFKPTSSFNINNTRDTVLTCAQGTIVHIPANAFIDENGNPVEGEVNFKVLEYYKMEDILLANLTTMSNGKILQTDGMLHLSAYTQDGLSCKLKDGEHLLLKMPTNKMNEDMLFFDGERDADSVMNWVPVSQNMNKDRYKIYTPYEVDKKVHLETDLTALGLNIDKFLPQNFKKSNEGLLIGCVISNQGRILSAEVILGGNNPDIKSEVKLDLGEFVKQLPKIKPAIKDGKPVNSYFIMPIAFDIKNKGYYHAANYNPDNDYKINFKELIMNPFEQGRQQYAFNATSLGWKNCDAFYEFEEQIPNVLANISKDIRPTTRVYMIPKGMKSIIPARIINNNWGFDIVGKGIEARFLAISIRNEEVKVAQTTLTIHDNKAIDFEFQTIDEDYLVEYIAQASSF